MSIEQQFADALADFEALVLEGCLPDAAIVEAAMSNGLSPQVLETRLSGSMPLEGRVVQIQQSAERAKFVAALDAEEAKVRRCEGVYASREFRQAKGIAQILASILQRDLSDHEVFMIEESVSPWIAEMKLARAAKTTPLRSILDEIKNAPNQ